MKVVFRVDASVEIGSGHLMRCLTLADALRARGAECHFISREHEGHLLEMLSERGYEISVQPCGPANDWADAGRPASAHEAWLRSDWKTDAAQTRAVLQRLRPNWLVVDHYALDARWERAVRDCCGHLTVIDDLADRPHACDLLVDQNYGRTADAYESLIPAGCVVLAGSQYALLRPEFAMLRQYSLQRRENPRLERLVVTMGGVDKDNVTGIVLDALKASPLPDECRITVVMGASAPWRDAVRQQAATLRWSTEVQVNVAEMAQLLADADLAIGAAGSSAWERCCLGVPSLIVVLADNQRYIAGALGTAGAALCADRGSFLGLSAAITQAVLMASQDKAKLRTMSLAAAALTDGKGVDRSINKISDLSVQ